MKNIKKNKFTVSAHLETEKERRQFKLICAHADTTVADAIRTFVLQSVSAGKLVIKTNKKTNVNVKQEHPKV